MRPTIPLPPQPTLTRWGISIEASVYYIQHFQLIKSVNKFEENNAIGRYQKSAIFNRRQRVCFLAFIKANLV